ncbi:hypothetical protein Mro03_27590 [Microbispora rosea subsp. rosea]|nr:hypothetical protein Mro03_27590 [Microbispora rosea subsp. rosea]
MPRLPQSGSGRADGLSFSRIAAWAWFALPAQGVHLAPEASEQARKALDPAFRSAAICPEEG